MKMNKRVKSMLPAVAFLLATSIIGTTVFGLSEKFATVKKATTLKAAPVVSSSNTVAHGVVYDPVNNSFDFGEDYNNEYERILGEDGFIYGMDWDWFGSWSEGTTSFGDNEITNKRNVYNAEYIERSLYNMKALGYNCVSVWVTHDGGGITYDSNGLATGLNSSFTTNFTAFLESCRRVGIDFVPTLLVHGYASNYNNTINGLTPQDRYYRYFRYYYEDEAREAFVENVIDPICATLSEYQDIIPMIDLTVENGTNAINDLDTGMLNTTYYGTTWENFGKIVNAMSDTVKKYMPNVYTSVEDVGWETNMFKYNDLKVDIIGRNEYSSGSVGSLKTRFSTKPSYIGEYNITEGNDSATEDYRIDVNKSIMENAIEGGYVGCFYYNWNNEAGGQRCFFSSANCDDYTTLRRIALEMSYEISKHKNEYKGISQTVLKPTLLYNNDSNTNYWACGSGCTSFTLQRTSNGGSTWTTIQANIDPTVNILDSGLFYCEDNTMVVGETYQYRVIGYMEGGETVTSDPGNETEVFVPTELFCNSSGEYDGSFESGSLNGVKANANSNGWYNAAWSNQPAEFTQATARTGSWCIHADVANGIGTNGDYSAKWAYNLQLTPNKLYEISYWYKNANGKIQVDVKRFDADTQVSSGVGGVSLTSDDEWHQATFKFTAPEDGKIRVFIMSRASSSTKFYIDDFSIIEAR